MTMAVHHWTRRQALAGTVTGLLAATGSYAWPAEPPAASPESPLQGLAIGCIGMRYQGSVIADKARAHGTIVAICDVDRHVREQARASFGSTPELHEDYRDLLARPDIDVITIGAPDHWHAKMLVDAVRAGKHVYCEKPLSLTIDEGRAIQRAVAGSDRIVQIGSWQRSDHRFRTAVELVRQGRLGTLQRVDVVLGKNEQGGPFPELPVPRQLNWDLWQGQTVDVPYCAERSHYTFRWWYEYSGGQMTDWGAHHLDIALWAIHSTPVRIVGRATFPQVANGYNVATSFTAEYEFANGVRLTVGDEGRNGILFTGSAGRLFVNRGTLAGDLLEGSLPSMTAEQFKLYPHDNRDRPARVGKLDAIVNHMGNFFDCVRAGTPPLSDVTSQHQAAVLCHLGNIAMRVGEPLRWDAETESIHGHSAAQKLQSREVRSGYEIDA